MNLPDADAAAHVPLADVASHLGVSRRTIQRWVRRLGLAVSHVGGSPGRWAETRIEPDDVAAIASALSQGVAGGTIVPGAIVVDLLGRIADALERQRPRANLSPRSRWGWARSALEVAALAALLAVAGAGLVMVLPDALDAARRLW